MDFSRIKYLRRELEEECIDLVELAEIEEEFNKIPDEELRDLRENALASDMLDELESRVDPIERILYDYLKENYGESEALEPCYALGPLVNHIRKEL